MTSISKSTFEIKIIAMVFSVVALLYPFDSAQAACATPTANVGSLDFQAGVFKYCDGTNWQPLGGGAATTDASLLTSGTLADARLSSNVPLLNAANTFTVGAQQITNNAAATIPFIVRAAGSQTATLTKWEDSVGATIYGLAPGGVPTAATDLADKGYVDTSVGNYVLKAGDTMTGALVNNTNSASTGLAVTQAGAGHAATFMGGNVGIGVAAPTDTLHVVGSTLFNHTANPAIKGKRSDDNDNMEAVMTLQRNRSSATAPGAGFGAKLKLDLEGFTSGGNIGAASIDWGWEAAQTNDTTARDGFLAFRTTLDNATEGNGGTERVRITSGGNVGIGTPGPTQKLEVSGNIRASGSIATGSQVITSGATSTLDFNNGNTISSNYLCGGGNITLANIRDGGTYLYVNTDTGGTAQCNFNTATTGTDAATVSFRFKPANAARTSSSHTIYRLTRVGTVVYVEWSSGL